MFFIISKVKTNIGSYHTYMFPKSVIVPSQKIMTVHGWGGEGSGKKRVCFFFPLPMSREERKPSDNFQIFF